LEDGEGGVPGIIASGGGEAIMLLSVRLVEEMELRPRFSFTRMDGFFFASMGGENVVGAKSEETLSKFGSKVRGGDDVWSVGGGSVGEGIDGGIVGAGRN